mmetsp:Transcript_41180/g.114466  ORF Transcript_41180/g.114466 Transcript_41180/m.114466 type:complete len:89 (-) Transcript_41180:294-560(-)
MASTLHVLGHGWGASAAQLPKEATQMPLPLKPERLRVHVEVVWAKPGQPDKQQRNFLISALHRGEGCARHKRAGAPRTQGMARRCLLA